ncbi:MAG: O-antigen ligase family protein, partial [Aeoliella sp.]
MNRIHSSMVCEQGAGWRLRIVLALAIGISAGLIGHHWRASQTLSHNTLLQAHERENQFAQRQGETTSRSALGFILLGVTGTFCLLNVRIDRLNWTHPLTIIFVAFVGWSILSIVWSNTPMLSFRKASILGLMAIGAYGIAARVELNDLIWITILYIAGLVAIGLCAELALGTFRPWISGYRFAGTQHPNSIGMKSAVLCLAATMVAFTKRDYLWLRCGLFVMGFTTLLLTKSRTALAALVVAGLVVALLSCRGRNRLLLGSLLVSIVCLLGIALNFVTIKGINDFGEIASLGRRENVESLTGRIPLWSELITAADDRLWLGHGIGGFWNSERIERYSDMFLWDIPHAHNSYLDLILSVGIVGLTLYLLWLLSVGFTSVARYERTGVKGDLFVVSVVLFSLVHALAESKIPAPGMPTFLLFACAAAVAFQSSPESKMLTAERRA